MAMLNNQMVLLLIELMGDTLYGVLLAYQRYSWCILDLTTNRDTNQPVSQDGIGFFMAQLKKGGQVGQQATCYQPPRKNSAGGPDPHVGHFPGHFFWNV